LESQFFLKNICRFNKKYAGNGKYKIIMLHSRSHWIYVIESAPHANHSISET
jgi:hypothetical protein